MRDYIDGLPDGAFELQLNRRLGGVVADDRGDLVYLSLEPRAAELERNDPGGSGRHLVAPLARDRAVARWPDLGDLQRRIACVREDEVVPHDFAFGNPSKIENRSRELNLGRGEVCGWSWRRGDGGSIGRETRGERGEETQKNNRECGGCGWHRASHVLRAEKVIEFMPPPPFGKAKRMRRSAEHRSAQSRIGCAKIEMHPVVGRHCRDCLINRPVINARSHGTAEDLKTADSRLSDG